MSRQNHVEVLAPYTTTRKRAPWVDRHVQSSRNNRSICKSNRHPSRTQLSIEKPGSAELLYSRIGQGRLIAGEGRPSGRRGPNEVVRQALDDESGDEAAARAGLDKTFGGRHCDDAVVQLNLVLLS